MITAYLVYLFFILLEISLGFFFIVYFTTLIYSALYGAPYVPTKNRELINFLKEANLKPGKLFIELGSGDGRVVRTAVREYGVRGIGVDINPVLVKLARWKAHRENLHNIEFRKENIVRTKLEGADYIYLFLFPALIEKVKAGLQSAAENGAIIISHGFKVGGWDKYIYKTIESKPFYTYYYRKTKKN